MDLSLQQKQSQNKTGVDIYLTNPLEDLERMLERGFFQQHKLNKIITTYYE